MSELWTRPVVMNYSLTGSNRCKAVACLGLPTVGNGP